MPYKPEFIARVAGAAVLGLALFAPSQPAEACGTMIFVSHAERPGGMNGQELFLSLGPDAATLVLSASFIDADGDKAFLLPLREAPTDVRDADDSLFAALDVGTVPVVTIEEDYDEPVGCGPLPGNDRVSFGSEDNDVEVLARGSTQTYDYVVVGGDTGSALADWLNTSGFGVPEQFNAALDAYVADGWYFLAARVNAGAREGRLAPLELQLPAIPGATTIPFGIGAYALAPEDSLDVTLYVAAQGSMLPQNYAVARIDPAELEATSESSSNYTELFEAAIGEGSTWVVEYSDPSWRPSDLEWWVNGDEELGVYIEGEVDEAWVAEFSARLGYEQARLTRLRARLGAAELVDMELTPAAELNVGRHFYVSWDPDAGEAEGCSLRSGSLGGLPVLLVLILVRRRRRED